MRDELAARIRDLTAGNGAYSEMKMFGGLCFMLNGNMQLAARRDGSLLVRVGKEMGPASLDRPGVEPMVMRGKPMEGYFYVAADELDEAALRFWFDLTAKYVRTLPAKQK